jgi:hypothetical protein
MPSAWQRVIDHLDDRFAGDTRQFIGVDLGTLPDVVEDVPPEVGMDYPRRGAAVIAVALQRPRRLFCPCAYHASRAHARLHVRALPPMKISSASMPVQFPARLECEPHARA